MPATIDELREAILAELTVHALSPDNLRLLGRPDTPEPDGAPPISMSPDDLAAAPATSLRRVCEVLDDHLGTNLLIEFNELFRSKWLSLLEGLRAFLAAALLIGVTYLVVGATAEGRSSLTSSPPAAFALLIALLLVLAVFEALQIVVTVLRLSDLTSAGLALKRIQAMHRVFRWEDGTRRFLAGRQFAVVFVVFIVSRLTTFSGDTWPFTATPMPAIITLLAFRYGLAGAFFTLWWGQLVPQFVANRRPLWFGNLPVSGVAFGFGNIVEKLGVTAPADWAAALDRSSPEAEIPISPQRRYRQAALTLEGIGQLGIRKTWELTPDGKANATHTVFTHVAAHNIERIATQGPIIGDPAPERLLSSQTLLRSGSDTPLDCHLQNDVPISDFQQQLAVATPRIGWFRSGDILHTEFRLEGRDPGRDIILIVGPTQHLLFRLTITHPPIAFPGVAVTVSRSGQDLGDAQEDRAAKGKITHRWIRPRILDDGSAVAEEFFPYPDVGTLYQFHWEVEW